MELNYYLSPIKKLLRERFPKGSIFESVHFLHEGSVDISADFFLLSVSPKEDCTFAIQCRNFLYRLFPRFEVAICDCGSLISGKTKKDTESALNFVYEQLSSFGKPIILLDSRDFLLGLRMYLGMNAGEISILSNKLDFEGIQIADLKESRNSLFNFLDLQTYLVSEDSVNLVIERGDSVIRHGQLIGNRFFVEPYLRTSKALFVDLSVLGGSVVDNCETGSANGIDAHDLCQYSYYHGRSDVSNFMLFSRTALGELASREVYYADIVAQSVWHYIVGRGHETIFKENSPDYKSYHVGNIHDDVEFCFYEDVVASIWWVKIENKENSKVIASSKEEYRQMLNGEVSERIVRAISYI